MCIRTLKIAIIELVDMGGRSFGVEDFRRVLNAPAAQNPLRYAGATSVQVPPSDVARERPVDLGAIRPDVCRRRVGAVNDDAIGQIAGTPLDRSRPLWEMYFIDGRPTGASPSSTRCTTRWPTGGGRQPAGAGHGSAAVHPGDDGADQSYETDPAPTEFRVGPVGVPDHFRHAAEIPSTIGYTVARDQPGAPPARASWG